MIIELPRFSEYTAYDKASADAARKDIERRIESVKASVWLECIKSGYPTAEADALVSEFASRFIGDK